MKIYTVFIVLLFAFSCSKKESAANVESPEISAVPPYDTVATDSFSAGAVSANVAQKIRMSSQAYQDSLQVVRKKLAAEKLALKEKEDLAKMQKKIDEEKTAREKSAQKSGSPAPDQPTNP